MASAARIKRDFIQNFGDAYELFGLPKLMGRIVGLLLYAYGAINLDDISRELKVSKGPVSQVTRRLRDNGLIQRVWVPGDRRDYYEAVPDIFGQAFSNHAKLMKGNFLLAKKYGEIVKSDSSGIPDSFRERVAEMERFYTVMLKHFSSFLDEWRAEKVHMEETLQSGASQSRRTLTNRGRG